jgi:hypothetical protein
MISYRAACSAGVNACPLGPGRRVILVDPPGVIRIRPATWGLVDLRLTQLITDGGPIR